MDNYLRHLEEQYSPKTSTRKLQYIEYNFGEFLKPHLTVLEVGPGFGEFLEALKRHGTTIADVIDRDEIIRISDIRIETNDIITLSANVHHGLRPLPATIIQISSAGTRIKVAKCLQHRFAGVSFGIT